MAEGFDYEHYRAEQSKQDLDKALLVTFEPGKKKNKKNHTFEKIDLIRVRVDKETEICREVTDEDKKRFKVRWEAYLAGEKDVVDGTPLKNWPELDAAQIATLKASDILSLEQLREVPDDQLPQGYQSLKYKCRDYMENIKTGRVLADLRDELDQKDLIIEGLKDKLATVDPDKIELLEKEILLLKAELKQRDDITDDIE